MTPELIAFVGQYGLPISMLLGVLVAGARGIWRWGREVDAANLRAERAEVESKEWQALALKAMTAGTKAVEVAANGNGKP